MEKNHKASPHKPPIRYCSHHVEAPIRMIPNMWKIGRIIPILKPGKKKGQGNQHGFCNHFKESTIKSNMSSTPRTKSLWTIRYDGNLICKKWDPMSLSIHSSRKEGNSPLTFWCGIYYMYSRSQEETSNDDLLSYNIVAINLSIKYNRSHKLLQKNYFILPLSSLCNQSHGFSLFFLQRLASHPSFSKNI